MASPHILIPILLLARLALAELTCADHPTPPVNPVLVSSWHFAGTPAHRSLYHPRLTSHRYAPHLEPASLKYDSLDWFWATTGHSNSDNYITLNLNRTARVYLLLPYEPNNNQYPDASMEGWKFEGYANLVKGPERLTYGVHFNESRFVPIRGVVFSRQSATHVVLPHHKWVTANLRGLRGKGDYVVMIAEADGKASLAPQTPPDVPEIIPNTKCPDALHEKWVTPDLDPNDPDTKGKMWHTWHPMWDPCFFCAYDHDHGSGAPKLIGYKPRYDYTAWKNDREEESNPGFKSVVFQHENVFVYYSVHVQTSKLRRVYEPQHTIALAILDAKTRELLVDITHKGDFGFLAARANPTGFIPLSLEDKESMDQQYEDKMPPRRRSINVIDVDNLDKRLSFQTGPKLLLGRYEDWTTQPICTKGGSMFGSGSITLDVTSPITGVKSVTELDVPVQLGYYQDGHFMRSTAQRRVLTIKDMKIGDENCMFDVGSIHGSRTPLGYFYTDAYGKELMDGPGRQSVRQFLKPGFSISLNGKYEALDSWLQMYEKDHLSVVKNIGFGLDPNEN